MIIVLLMGGMGNQMFQYAFGRSLSLKYNVPLKIDLSFLKRRDLGSDFTYRDYDLDLFNVTEDFKIFPPQKVLVLQEPHFHFSQKAVNFFDGVNGNLLIQFGYWQSPKYFESIEEVIRKDFEFKQTVSGVAEEMMSKIKETNSVMVNVRRTDFLNMSVLHALPLKYVMDGVEVIRSKVDNPHFFIFSDDIEWCKENIKLENMTIVDHKYKGERFGFYLQLMKACKHFIIPNSTFAWWSAWLNNNSGKIVIAPQDWFADKNINTADLIPSDWIRV